MSTAGPAPELGATRTLRPNPFAFASDTSFRFALLIAGVAGATPFIWSQLWLLGNMDQARVAMTTCARRHQPTSTDDPAEFFRNYIDAGSAVWSCMRPAWGRPAALIGLVGVAVLFAVAAILYWCMPSWRIRRLRLEPLPADAIPGMVDELERLQDEAGVRGQVRFLIDAVNRSAGALAFGRVGRRYIVLHAGLIKQFDDDRPAFGAIVRHELAHVRNGDLDKTYLAVAIWWAFVAVALVPFVGNELLQAARGQGATLVRISWRVVAVTLLVLLARNGVLRARELYADARASTWEGSVGGLRRILADGASLPQRQVPRWRIPFRFHPSPRQRLATLDDTRPLLAIGFWEALAAGLVAALAIETVQGSLDGLTDLTLAAAHANLWRTGLLYGPLVAGVVGLGVWRAAFADHLAGGSHSVLRPNRLGVGLGVGLALGSRYLNLKAGVINETDDAVGREVPAVTLLIGAAVIIAGSWLVVRWFAMAAAAWMPVVATRRSPRPLSLVAVAVAALVMTAVLPLLLWMDSYAVFLAITDVDGVLVLLVTPLFGQGFMLPAAAVIATLVLPVLWAYPLAGASWQARTRSPAPWVSLDGAPPTPKQAPRQGVRPWTAVRTGLVMAGILGLLLVADRLRARGLVPVNQRQSEQWLGSFYLRVIALGILAQPLAAIIASLRANALRVPHGLLAAFVTGVLAVVGVTASGLVDTCGVGGLGVDPTPFGCSWSIAGDFLLDSIGLELRIGGMFALVAALVTTGVIGAMQRLRRPRRRNEERPAQQSPLGGAR